MAKKQKQTNRTALIDGDVFIFRAALLAETPIEWGDDIWTLHANMGDAINLFDSFIETAKELTGSSMCVIALSDTANFRKLIMPSYKHNRRDKRPPLLRWKLRELVETKYPELCVSMSLLEGDDVLGIYATGKRLAKEESVIVSIDKDMKTIPASYFDYDNHTLTTYTVDEANYNHLVQTLTGDTADGYKGCPGVGIKGAEKILADSWRQDGTFDVDHGWLCVIAAFEKAGLDAAEALLQARVARVCRAEDYDFANRRPIPWKS